MFNVIGFGETNQSNFDASSLVSNDHKLGKANHPEKFSASIMDTSGAFFLYITHFICCISAKKKVQREPHPHVPQTPRVTRPKEEVAISRSITPAEMNSFLCCYRA